MLKPIVFLLAACAACLVAAETPEPKFVPLFDGKTLDGWRGYQDKPAATWSVRDGAIYCNGKTGNDLVTKKKFTDFELRFEWKIAEKGNSGVIYRVAETEDKSYKTGPEYQILDDGNASAPNPASESGGVYALYGAEEKELRLAGEYNESRIVVRGDQIEHWLNGSKVVECMIGSEDWNKKVAASKFANWKNFAKNKNGHVALQNHDSEVWFRKIEIKEVKPEPKPENDSDSNGKAAKDKNADRALGR